MIAAAYFGISIFLAYWVGSRNAAFGIVLFLVSVGLWQVVMDGPGSLLASSGCDYGHAARDC